MLYTRLVKLAQAHPELKGYLAPLLKKHAGEAPMQEEGFEPEETKAKEPPKTPSGRKKKGPPPKWDEFMQSVYGGKDAKLPNPNTDPKIRERHPDLLISTILSEYPESPTAKGVMKKYKAWLKDQGKGKSEKPSKAEEKPSKAEEKPKAEESKLPEFKPGSKVVLDKTIDARNPAGREGKIHAGVHLEVLYDSEEGFQWVRGVYNGREMVLLVKRDDIKHLFKDIPEWKQPASDSTAVPAPKAKGEDKRPEMDWGAEVVTDRDRSWYTWGGVKVQLPAGTKLTYQKTLGRYDHDLKFDGPAAKFTTPEGMEVLYPEHLVKELFYGGMDTKEFQQYKDKKMRELSKSDPLKYYEENVQHAVGSFEINRRLSMADVDDVDIDKIDGHKYTFNTLDEKITVTLGASGKPGELVLTAKSKSGLSKKQTVTLSGDPSNDTGDVLRVFPKVIQKLLAVNGPRTESVFKGKTLPKGKVPTSWKHKAYSSSEVPALLTKLNKKLKVKLTEESLTELLGLPFLPWDDGLPKISIEGGAAAYHDDDDYDDYDYDDERKHLIHLVLRDQGHVDSMHRQFGIDRDGNPYIHNDVLVLERQVGGKKPPRGVGARVFLNEVVRASEAGFKYVYCEALWRPPKWVGGKVWPKLGYDGEIPFDYPCCPDISPDTAPDLPDELEDAMRDKGFRPPWRISHLWQVDGGPEWWEMHGVTFKGEFDLTPGSYSMNFIKEYIPKKAAEAGMSVEDYLSGKDYLKDEDEETRQASWVMHLDRLAAKKDEKKPKKDKDEGKGHEQIDTDEFDDKFSRDYWKTSKKSKK